jgi:thiamine-phosphate pyrophosphorylase
LRLPAVYPILDTGTLERLGLDPVEAAEAILEGGARILQFRHKSFWSRGAFVAARLIARFCQDSGAVFIVNDRADYAHLLGAGLHLGQEDLLPADARSVIGPAAVVGFSTHNSTQMEDARVQPVDYVAFGPVFPTATKERPDLTTGVEALRHIRTLTGLPLVAIGGITRGNAAECFAAGADSVAIIADLFPNPSTKQKLRERMSEWHRLGDAAVQF